MYKKLLFITLAWLCAVSGMADTLTIVRRFEKIEHASVLASYRNEFGAYRKPNMDVEFPYALIRVHIEGNESAVTKAKERFALYLGQHYTTKAKNTSRVNEIMFLVPIGAGHVELQCGDGCQSLTLFDYSQLTADAIYEGKVRYAMEKVAVQSEPTPVSRQFFKFRVSPADAMVEVDENGKKEIWKVVDGVARKALYHGNYAYSVSANRYHTQEGVITVSDANTETTIALKPRFGWLSITGGSEANGASVYATNTTTGVRQSLGTIPLTKVELDPGEYSLLILQDQYKDYSLSIQISENNETSVRASLAPNFARVTLRAAAGNEILIDEQKKGTGSWTGTLELGDYVVETRQAGHRAAYTSIAVTALSEGKTITLNQPTPIYGSLMVDGLPADATVYVDGVKKGLTPMIVNKLLIGSHQVHIEKEGYAKQEKLVQITEGQEAVMDYALTKETPKPAPTSKETFMVNGVPFNMIKVQGGTFTMGATSEQGSEADSDEKPTHQVTLSDYMIGETEVTQELWQAVMGSNPSAFSGANLPVEEVGWNDCQTFIKKLNQLTGKKFRLPTEAEWEYAARGGNKSKGYKYAGSNTLSDVAWYTNNSSKTHPVKQKQANELGLYDMSGNVWEWCQNWYGSYSSSWQTNPKDPSSGSYRVIRGGGWSNSARLCRVSIRNYYTPASTCNYLGLRLAL